MAWLAVNKDGSELISDYTLFRNGTYKHYTKCDPIKCNNCVYSKVICKLDDEGKRYKRRTYSSPPTMSKEESIKLLSFWDNFEFDSDGNDLDYIVFLPEGSIEKLIGRKLTWEDEPVELV